MTGTVNEELSHHCLIIKAESPQEIRSISTIKLHRHRPHYINEISSPLSLWLGVGWLTATFYSLSRSVITICNLVLVNRNLFYPFYSQPAVRIHKLFAVIIKTINDNNIIWLHAFLSSRGKGRRKEGQSSLPSEIEWSGTSSILLAYHGVLIDGWKAESGQDTVHQSHVPLNDESISLLPWPGGRNCPWGNSKEHSFRNKQNRIGGMWSAINYFSSLWRQVIWFIDNGIIILGGQVN